MAKFYIAEKSWNKVINYAKSSYDQFKAEIGGMMIAHRDDDGDFILSDPIILKQRVTAAHCTLDKEELAQYYVKTAMKHKKLDSLQFVWWHSHHTMDAFWSPTDLNAIDQMSSGQMSMSLVVNLKEEYKFRVNIWQPVTLEQDVTLNILGKEKTIPQSITDEVKKKCTAHQWKTAANYPTYENRIGLSSDQGYTYDARQIALFNDSYAGASPEDTERQIAYEFLCGELDDINSDYCTGTIDFKVYQDVIKDLNKEAAKKKLNYRVGLCKTADELDGIVYYIESERYICTVDDEHKWNAQNAVETSILDAEYTPPLDREDYIL
jgi:hypothetical protein